MEIPDPRQVYSGAQRPGAGSRSDNEVRHQVYSGDSEGTTSMLQIVPDLSLIHI